MRYDKKYGEGLSFKIYSKGHIAIRSIRIFPWLWTHLPLRSGHVLKRLGRASFAGVSCDFNYTAVIALVSGWIPYTYFLGPSDFEKKPEVTLPAVVNKADGDAW